MPRKQLSLSRLLRRRLNKLFAPHAILKGPFGVLSFWDELLAGMRLASSSACFATYAARGHLRTLLLVGHVALCAVASQEFLISASDAALDFTHAITN